jgi:uncharacterized Tic20 family protein
MDPNHPSEVEAAKMNPTEPAFAGEGGTVAALTKEAKTMGMLCHLAAFATFLLPAIGNIIGPLVVWLIKKDEMPFVDDQGKEALNFQITILILGIISGILMIVLIGILLLPLVGLYWLIFTIIGGIKANEGIAYRYPFAIRMLK